MNRNNDDSNNNIIENKRKGKQIKNKSILTLNKNNKKKKKNKTILKTTLESNNKKEKDLNISELNDNQKYKYCKKIMNPNDYEINNLSYKNALRIDKRTFTQYYFSLLRTNNLFVFSFFQKNDYNSIIIKIFIFFFILIINFFVNALFFDDSTMHVIYQEKGKFNIIYQIPKIVYSAIISGAFTFIIKFLSLTEKAIINFKNEKNINLINRNEKEVIKSINKRIIVFFIISFIFLVFFWYYISCFCVVYNNTQIHLIKDFISSFVLSLIYPFFIHLLPGIFRIYALKANNRDKIYKFSIVLQIL